MCDLLLSPLDRHETVWDMQLLVPHWLGTEVLGKLLSLQTPRALSYHLALHWGGHPEPHAQQ